MTDRIALAHEAPFRLGALTVCPPTRELTHDDGRVEVLEPRVMQVLIALARASGGVLTRHELTEMCWEGRVVGEDAIQRVMSRLRRYAEGIGAGYFHIETLTRVGYRLIVEAAAPSGGIGTAPLGVTSAASRRAVVLGVGGVALSAVAGGAWWFARETTTEEPPAAVRALIAQARLGIGQGTAEGFSQAMGLRRRITEIAPDYADGWGELAESYANAALFSADEDERAMRARAIEAARRALTLDRDNPQARMALGSLTMKTGDWLRAERLARDILRTHPNNENAILLLCFALLSVGRCREAGEVCDRFQTIDMIYPTTAYRRVVLLWAADRLDDADRAMHSALSLFPTHYAVWFASFYLLLYTGRANEALAMGENRRMRPTEIPDWNFDAMNSVARAMLSRRAEDIDTAMRLNLDLSRRGVGFAENAMQFAAALGRTDTAFEIAGAYFFARGFDPGETRWHAERRVLTRRRGRHTRMLFLPSTAAMRADARFDGLIGELGLKRYWRESGTRPDYLNA